MRLVLLQKSHSRDLPVYQATAGVLADMTKVLEQGLQYNMPLEQIQRRYGMVSAAKMGGKAPKNEFEAKKAERQVADQMT